MANNFNVSKGIRYGLQYRLVEGSDAEFIVKLRNNSKLVRFIHSTSNSVLEQIEWTKLYKKREEKGQEYYYIFENNKGTKLGISRLYNIQKDNFTHGSWVFTPTAPAGSAILGDIIVREIGFKLLKRRKNIFDVRRNNKEVIKYHMRYCPDVIKRDELNIYYELNLQNFERGKQNYLNILKNLCDI